MSTNAPTDTKPIDRRLRWFRLADHLMARYKTLHEFEECGCLAFNVWSVFESKAILGHLRTAMIERNASLISWQSQSSIIAAFSADEMPYCNIVMLRHETGLDALADFVGTLRPRTHAITSENVLAKKDDVAELLDGFNFHIHERADTATVSFEDLPDDIAVALRLML